MCVDWYLLGVVWIRKSVNISMSGIDAWLEIGWGRFGTYLSSSIFWELFRLDQKVENLDRQCERMSQNKTCKLFAHNPMRNAWYLKATIKSFKPQKSPDDHRPQRRASDRAAATHPTDSSQSPRTINRKGDHRMTFGCLSYTTENIWLFVMMYATQLVSARPRPLRGWLC